MRLSLVLSWQNFLWVGIIFDLKFYFDKQAHVICLLYARLCTVMVLNAVIFEEYEFWSIKNYIKGGVALIALVDVFPRNRACYWFITLFMTMLFIDFLQTL